MIINEFDPISHDQNEISWEYHWHDFVSFNRQYGDNVVFINDEEIKVMKSYIQKRFKI